MKVLTVKEILNARSSRQEEQNKILKKYGGNLVSMTMNIPGPKKNSEAISKAFARAYFGLVEVLKFEGYIINHIEFSNEISGPIGFVSTEGQGNELKRLLVLYENSTTIGRLLDIDLINADKGLISRSDLELSPRKCFLCDEPANFCRRIQSHTYEELLEYVEHQLTEYNTWKV